MAKKKLDFEQAIERIEEIVEILENEEVSLEKSISLYKEGIELSLICKEKLSEAEREVIILKKDSMGNIEEISFNSKEDNNEF